MVDLDDDALLEALGFEVEPVKIVSRTAQEERIIAGFEDILRFYQAHSRAPQHGEGRDIFERLYAVRLDRLRQLPETQSLLAEFDHIGLLADAAQWHDVESMDEDELMAELGIDAAPADSADITVLRHVRSTAQKRETGDVADRATCPDFIQFQPLFEQAEREFQAGLRIAKRFAQDTSIEVGNFFIVGGQVAYVAEVGVEFVAPNGKPDARLRVIYDNGTESNLLRLSLQRALYKDETGRRLTDVYLGPMFADQTPAPPESQIDADDIASGTIYVLRSRSDHPYIAQHRELIHKIGVTGGRVETRITGADKDPTYLLADVEIVATYQLHNLNRVKMEKLFHRLFAAAQLELTLQDRFGNPVKPKEWFMLPLSAIDEAVKRIQDGSITQMLYDPSEGRLVLAD
ncbi:MAG: GIY-YIG nuclease family protein [Flavobacteriales bacterium]